MSCFWITDFYLLVTSDPTNPVAPRSRTVAFIITELGARAPRILAFPDYRENDGNRPE
jgi:hypothetical protein